MELPRWDDDGNDDSEDYQRGRMHSRATSSISSYHGDLNMGALSEMDGDEGDDQGEDELEPAPVKVCLVFVVLILTPYSATKRPQGFPSVQTRLQPR